MSHTLFGYLDLFAAYIGQINVFNAKIREVILVYLLLLSRTDVVVYVRPFIGCPK